MRVPALRLETLLTDHPEFTWDKFATTRGESVCATSRPPFTLSNSRFQFFPVCLLLLLAGLQVLEQDIRNTPTFECVWLGGPGPVDPPAPNPVHYLSLAIPACRRGANRSLREEFLSSLSGPRRGSFRPIFRFWSRCAEARSLLWRNYVRSSTHRW